jgi:redox-sensitive bicupin YhaK (pirin superfamily)
METRKTKRLSKSRATLEGAGVHLKRAFGNSDVPQFDPFLLLDDFRGSHPKDYIKGFPWHPHRGIETITYVLAGDVEHGDSMGNKGVISSGDVQWMTAGSGIVHQEMPKGNSEGKMYGFQLWTNLPASHKMMPPRYRDIKSSEIPEVLLDNQTKIKVICGTVNGVSGPAKDIISDPEYIDVTAPAYSEFVHRTKRGYTVFAYVIDGKGYFSDKNKAVAPNETLILFEDGDQVLVHTEEEPVRFLLLSGKPIGEPVEWYGPIVMNTQEELKVAFDEYQNGTFIK